MSDAVSAMTGRAGSCPRLIPVRNPRTGVYDFEMEITGVPAVKEVAARLRQSGKSRSWAELPVADRAEALIKLADALDGSAGKAIRDALEVDTGRRRIASLEVTGVAGSIRGWSSQAGQLLPTDAGWTDGLSNPNVRHSPRFVPYGLVGIISPWNFPLLLSMVDAVPALLAGCLVLIKPSEITPRFVRPFRDAIIESGLEDVLAVVTGDGPTTGAALLDVVDAVCFTGSVATGRTVAVSAARNMIPAFLELGGKDPMIVTETADVEAASDAALRGSVLSTGQACQSIERIYVASPSHDAFLTRLVEKARDVRFNWPDIGSGHIGPIISKRQAEVLASQIADAVAKGARVETGGTIDHHGGGLWLAATVLSGVSHGMDVMREETFGPVLPVMPFDSIEEAIKLANDSDYGLSAAVFAGTLAEAEEVADRIDAGAVSLNDAALTALFYEAEKESFKLSGMGGSRMGTAGFRRFFRRKALIANTAKPAPIDAFAENGSG